MNDMIYPPQKERWKVKKSELLALPEHDFQCGLHRIDAPYQMRVSIHKIKNSEILKATLFDRRGEVHAIIFCDKEIERDITYLPLSAKWSEACLENLAIEGNEWCYKSRSIVSIIYCPNYNEDRAAAKYFGHEAIPSADSILAYQYEIRNNKLQRQHERTRQYIESLMCQLKPIPTDLDDYAKKHVFTKHRYIFYKRRGKEIEGICSYCHSGVSLDAHGHKHNDEIRCPHCHKKVTLKAAGKIKDIKKDCRFVVINAISTGLMLRRFHAWSEVSHFQNKMAQENVEIFEDARAYIPFSGTKAKHYVKEYENGEETWKYAEGTWPHWYYGSCSNIPAFWFDLYHKGLTKELKGTPFEYSGLLEAAKSIKQHFGMNIDPETYLFRWRTEPILEPLIKAKLFSLALAVYQGQWNIKAISPFSSKQDHRLYKLLKVKKSDIEVIRKYDFTQSQLKIFQLVLREPDAMNFVKLAKMKSDKDQNKPSPENLYPRLKKCIEVFGVKVTRRIVFDYLPTQMTETYSNIELMLSDWLDYTEECRTLQYNMEDTMVLYPKKLLHSHSITSRKIEKRKTMMVDKQIRHRYKSDRPKYEYRSGDYMVMLPRNQTDLINEGKRLCHCVGGYDKRVASGSTTILFIRRRNDPSVPFVTAEFSDGRVAQIRAYKNGVPDEDTMKFFEEYKAKILSKFMTKAGKTA